ncbi:MAG: DUF4197 domain-containing protein [Bacteroidales bacterium]|jgi:hypothetical protein|nr:DUF4197 domain-containing protein [Bacteroidales bacterium]
MKNIILTLVFVCICNSCQTQGVKSLWESVKSVNNASSGGWLSNSEVIAGLKEALTIGAKESAMSASAVDGFYRNAKISIPWPAEAQKMKGALEKIGFGKQVSAFEESMNRAAEEAAKGAYDVFAGAVKEMTIKDGFAILNGADTAATHYLREKTTAPLKEKFSPVVKNAIEKVNITSYWNPLVTAYNKIPGVTRQNPNLEAYITGKAIDGLMTLIAEQEVKIRKDPAAQVTALLKKVFGAK